MKSEICIFNVETGATDVLAAADDLRLESPNWSPDDRFLMVNGDGVLFRIEFNDPNALQQIDTDFAVKCNADHGISPDGKTIAFSQGSQTSIVYTVSVEGGLPHRVTIDEPAHFHGWSPDGETLLYAGRPSGPFQIFSIPSEGGEPTKLTDGEGQKHGPEFTPDGKWIWFNSDRGGRMDLWRMKADGSDLEQMTRGEEANWFPHPSPDGSSILYLAYSASAGEALVDQKVSLKLLPSDGGEPKVLAEFTGGHGTINGPCWAPDGKRFAYIRYV